MKRVEPRSPCITSSSRARIVCCWLWFAGEDFSAADIQMSFPLEAGLVRGDKGRWPNVARLVGRVRDRPAYVRAVERGGPVEMLL